MTINHKLDDETKAFLAGLIGALKDIKIRVVIEVPNFMGKTANQLDSK